MQAILFIIANIVGLTALTVVMGFFMRRCDNLLIPFCDQVTTERGFAVPHLVGTLIEVPRAALTADLIAAEADFFSFGTNDLTQMTWGFSRDDVEAAFFPA